MVYSKVIDYCVRNGMSVMAFEKKCGLTNGTVNGWKNGNNPSMASLGKIVKATEVPLEFWVDFKGDD